MSYFKLFASFTILLVTVFACDNNSQKKSENVDPQITQGKEIIYGTIDVLTRELKQAMRRGGVKEAVPYCNTQAIPLTEKMAQKYHAEVRRTSLKNRNPQNKPNAQEAAIIAQYEQEMTAGKKLQPKLTKLADGRTMFNAPILTRAVCLNCHGTVGQQVSKSNYQIIQSLYPKDKATGYKVAELRGIWSVIFEK